MAVESSPPGEWGWWGRVQQLRRTAEQRGLWLERTGYEGDRSYWLLVDATTSAAVAGLDSGHPDMRLGDVETHLSRLA